MYATYNAKRMNAGFSLLEVIIVSAIIGIVTTMVLYNYGGFNSATLLKNQALELALDIRQAQVSAISVRGTDIGGTFDQTTFRRVQGVHFSEANSASYLFFIDSGTGVGIDETVDYDVEEDELIDTFYLDPRYEIENVCELNNDGSCIGGADDRIIDVVFKRPHFDAYIYKRSSPSASPSRIDKARITIMHTANPEAKKHIDISSTGLIEVID